MRRKIINCSVALIAFVAVGMIPASASAATPELDVTLGSSFHGLGGATELVANGKPPVKCTGSTNVGNINSATTGGITLTLSGCTYEGTACTTTGQAAGTIKFGSSVFHLVYLNASKTPGILITPPTGGTFAEFKCNSGFTIIKIGGNGVLGHINNPTCGTAGATSLTYSFTSTGPTQTYRQVEGMGATYNLTTSTNGGAAVETALVTTGTATLNSAKTFTFTCP